jgi:uncharacterized protein with PIN domain
MEPFASEDRGTAIFTLDPALDFFLPSDQRGRALELSFRGGPSLKHILESQGIPHTEVGAVTVNDRPTALGTWLRDGDRVHVAAWTLTSSSLTGEPRFLLDNHLGRLAAYLRMLGMDTLYPNPCDDEELAALSEEEDRVLLSRDRRLLMRKVVRYGYCPRSLESRDQIFEVAARYHLAQRIRPFQRCLRCNTLLNPVAKEAVDSQLEPLTRRYYDEFHRCPHCGQVYWKGSHYEHMLELVERLSNTEQS